MIDFSTNEYRSSHGAQPRGRGNWFFAFDGREAHTDLACYYDTFAKAKKRALVEAKRRGARSVKVMS